MGHVEGIFVAPAAAVLPTSIHHVEAVAGEGLRGDRYAAGVGTYSSRGGAGRHLTLIAAEAIEGLAGDGVAIDAAEARRNLVVRGVDLDALLGRRFRIGDVECQGVRTCPPCAHLERLTTEGVHTGLAGGGGLRADILVGGTLQVGDPVTLD